MKAHKDDRRSQRSQRLLGNALVELMHEKRYADITVQDILDRADVGRSTFYAHYQDKEDLLISNLEKMLENFIHHLDRAGDGRALLSTVEFFRHIKETQELYRAMMRGQGLDLLFSKGQAMMSQKIEQHLSGISIEGLPPSIPIPFVANFLAGSFLTLLKWWLDHKLVYSPEQMDAMYQQLVIPGTLAALHIDLKGL